MVHRDLKNHNKYNLMIIFGSPRRGGGLWIEDEGGEPVVVDPKTGVVGGSGVTVVAKLQHQRYVPFLFEGKKQHWTEPFEGERFSVTFFTHRNNKADGVGEEEEEEIIRRVLGRDPPSKRQRTLESRASIPLERRPGGLITPSRFPKVGRRIEVYWTPDLLANSTEGEWYPGRITDVRTATGGRVTWDPTFEWDREYKWLVAYDDGETKWESLDDCPFDCDRPHRPLPRGAGEPKFCRFPQSSASKR